MQTKNLLNRQLNGIKVAFIATLILGSFEIFSQKQQLADSAISLLSKNPESVQERLELLRIAANESNSPAQKIDLSRKLISLGQEVGDMESVIRGLTLLSRGHKISGELDLAFESQYDLLRIADSLDNKILKGDALSNMASIQNSRRRYNQALNLQLQANLNYQETGDSMRISSNSVNIGNTYFYLSNTDSALHYLRQALDFSTLDIIDDYAKSTISLVLAKVGNLDSADRLLNQTLEKFLAHQDYYAYSDCLIQFGGVLISRNEIKKGINYTTRGYRTARSQGLKEQVQDGARILTDAHKKLKDYSRALEYQTEYYAYRDSLINAESIQRIADQRRVYEVGQKQAQVDLLEAQQETQRIILWGMGIGLGFFLVFSITLFRFYQAKNRFNKELSLQKEELERLNNTKDKFFSIISHDLRSPVAAFMGVSRMIKILVQNKKTEDLLELTGEIDQSVDRLSGLLDNLLNWATQQQGHMPNIPEKINAREMMNGLVGVFKNMADSKHIALTSNIPESMSIWADKNSVATIFRNLVNNALKFTPEGGQVQITGEEKAGNGIIRIQDTGMGMDESKISKILEAHTYSSSYGTGGEKGLGLGLKLVQEFVKMNNGHISIESQEGKGTTFTISLPLFEEVKVLAD